MFFFFFRIVWYSSSVSCSGQWNGSLHSTSAILHQFWGNQNKLNCWISTSIKLAAKKYNDEYLILPKSYSNWIMLYIIKVLECSWDELLTKVKEAEDFDNVIAAHQVFLNTVISRCLLDEQSRVGKYYCIQAPSHTF